MLGLSALEDVQHPSPVYPQRPPKTGHCQECCKYIWFHPLTREKIKGFLMFTAGSFSDFVWCNIREQRDNSHMKTCAKLWERTVITNPIGKKNSEKPTFISYFCFLLCSTITELSREIHNINNILRIRKYIFLQGTEDRVASLRFKVLFNFFWIQNRNQFLHLKSKKPFWSEKLEKPVHCIFPFWKST